MYSQKEYLDSSNNQCNSDTDCSNNPSNPYCYNNTCRQCNSDTDCSNNPSNPYCYNNTCMTLIDKNKNQLNTKINIFKPDYQYLEKSLKDYGNNEYLQNEDDLKNIMYVANKLTSLGINVPADENNLIQPTDLESDLPIIKNNDIRKYKIKLISIEYKIACLINKYLENLKTPLNIGTNPLNIIEIRLLETLQNLNLSNKWDPLWKFTINKDTVKKYNTELKIIIESEIKDIDNNNINDMVRTLMKEEINLLKDLKNKLKL